MPLTFPDTALRVGKNTHFSKEVIGGGSVVVPHCHFQRLLLQLKAKCGEEAEIV